MIVNFRTDGRSGRQQKVKSRFITASMATAKTVESYTSISGMQESESEEKSLRDARQMPKRRINYNQVKFAIDVVKELMRKENDGQIKDELCKAGLTLNKIYLR